MQTKITASFFARPATLNEGYGPDVAFATLRGNVVRAEDIKVGMALLGPDGTKRIVESTWSGTRPMYKVAYSGDSFVVDTDNPFVVPKPVDAKFRATLDPNPYTFEETVDSYRNRKMNIREQMRMYRADCMAFGESSIDLSIGAASPEEVAWAIGFWLGDGWAKTPNFTVHIKKTEILAKIRAVAANMGMTFLEYKHPNKNCTIAVISAYDAKRSQDTPCYRPMRPNPFMNLLRTLDIYDNKRIPFALRNQPASVRCAIVAGMIDSDGCFHDGQFELTQTKQGHTQLFKDFVWLLRSLGFRCHVNEKYGKKDPKGNLRTFFNRFVSPELPIAATRKRGHPFSSIGSTSVQFEVESIGRQKYYGFKVSGDGQILLSDFVVVKN
ncbi:hypothetical protein EC988_000470 [Linderina pennispora]|nr:hypothetical protein EC988_000470 [Linderina pennispora]